jgi:hypothetical protein
MTNAQRRRWLVVAVVAMVALLLGFLGLDAILTGLGTGTVKFSLNDISSPDSLLHYNEWQNADLAGTLTPAGFIYIHLALDVGYMVAYGSTAFLLIGLFTATLAPSLRRQRGLHIVLAAVLVIDVIEDIGFLIGSKLIDSGGVPVLFGEILAWVTVAKWVALISLLFGIIWHGIQCARERGQA